MMTESTSPSTEPSPPAATIPNNRFPGQWFQMESDLYQNWMRDYDPTTGRYMQADPLGLVDGASVYGYAMQNPGRYVDPRGEQTVGEFLTSPFGLRVLGIAGGAAIADSPVLPFGDAVGLCILGAAYIYCLADENNCSIATSADCEEVEATAMKLVVTFLKAHVNVFQRIGGV